MRKLQNEPIRLRFLLSIILSINLSCLKEQSGHTNYTDDSHVMSQEVDKDLLKNIVEELSSDKMEGRRPGSAGHSLATQYIEDQFKSINLPVTEVPNPFKGDCIIFIGKGKRKIKILYADRSGLLLLKKSFADQAMKTKLKFLSEPGIRSISWSELVLILDGASYEIFHKVDDWPKEDLT